MKSIGKFIIGCLLFLLIFNMIHEGESVVNDESNATETAYEEQSEDDPEDAEYKPMTTKELKKFKKSCKELNYKKVMRNPSKYEGKNFYTTIRVSEVVTGKTFLPGKAYCAGYLTYYDSDYQDYLDNYDRYIYVFDYQNTKRKSYVKMLEDDIVKVYGTFTGLSSSKNALTWETSDTMALDVKYVKLLQE